MSLTLMSSGMFMNLLLAMYYCGSSLFDLVLSSNSQSPPHTFTVFTSPFFVVLLVLGLQYNFEGRYDLVRFIKTVQKVGLYVHLRIGPYVCAEWNFGYMLLQLSCVDSIVYIFQVLSLSISFKFVVLFS